MEIWCEFEEWEDLWDPDVDFCNIIVNRQGIEVGLNVWTYAAVLDLAKEAAENRENANGAYLLPPDLLVRRLDRKTITLAVEHLIGSGEFERVVEISKFR